MRIQCGFFEFRIYAASTLFSLPFELHQHMLRPVFWQRTEAMLSFLTNPVISVHYVRVAVKDDVHVIVGIVPEEMLDRIPCDKERHLRVIFAVPIDEVVVLVKQYGVSAKY